MRTTRLSLVKHKVQFVGQHSINFIIVSIKPLIGINAHTNQSKSHAERNLKN